MQPEKDKDIDIKNYCEIMDALDELGMLTRIFLAELLDVSRQLYPRLLGDGNILFETSEFLSFCREIAQRKTGEETDLDFNKKRLRMSLILVAKASKRRLLGADTYIGRFKKCVANGSNSVYFTAWGRTNINFSKEITDEIGRLKLGTKISESLFSVFTKDGRIKAICAKIKVSNDLVDEIQEAAMQNN